jgi:hypothetical protein
VPFTVSHAIVAVPFRSRAIPATAVAAGAMAPDASLFVPVPFGRGLSHAPLGVVSVDLVVGALLVVVWVVLLRAPARSLAPRFVRARLGPARVWTARTAALALVGLVIGGLTHIGWDAFTHTGGAGVALVPALAEVHGPFPGYRWAQYASGVIGLLGLVLVGVIRLARARALPTAQDPVRVRLVRLLLVSALTTVIVLATAPAVEALVLPLDALRPIVVRAVIGAGTGTAMVVLAVAVVWWLAVGRSSREHPSRG